MRARAVCLRYEGPAVQSQLWTGVTTPSTGPTSHWSAFKCAPIINAYGLSDCKVWQCHSYASFETWCCFSNDRLSYFEVWFISFI